VTISSIGSTTNALTALAQISAQNVQTAQNQQINLISQRLQEQLNAKIAAYQKSTDDSATAVTQAQLNSAQNQLSTISTMQTNYGTNVNTLNDLTAQLAAMQTAVTNGDSAGFDGALTLANNDVGSLVVVNPLGSFQPDGVSTFKINGLGISDSSTYDLSTPAGQAAAQTAIQNAQNTVNTIYQVTSANNTLAAAQKTALSGQVNALQSTINTAQQNQQTLSNTQIQQMMTNEQNQLHLIELSLGNSQALSNALAQAMSPPQPAQSVFDVLVNAVGATPATYAAQQSTPAILSLLT
jgi:hypothetical protein